MLDTVQTKDFGYHFSIRPINQKAWIDINRPRFSYLQPILYLVVRNLALNLCYLVPFL